MAQDGATACPPQPLGRQSVGSAGYFLPRRRAQAVLLGPASGDFSPSPRFRGEAPPRPPRKQRNRNSGNQEDSALEDAVTAGLRGDFLGMTGNKDENECAATSAQNALPGKGTVAETERRLTARGSWDRPPGGGSGRGRRLRGCMEHALWAWHGQGAALCPSHSGEVPTIPGDKPGKTRGPTPSLPLDKSPGLWPRGDWGRHGPSGVWEEPVRRGLRDPHWSVAESQSGP